MIVVGVSVRMAADGLHTLLEVGRVNVTGSHTASLRDGGEELEEGAALCPRPDHAVVHNLIWAGSRQDGWRPVRCNSPRQGGNGGYGRRPFQKVTSSDLELIFHSNSPRLGHAAAAKVAWPTS